MRVSVGSSALYFTDGEEDLSLRGAGYGAGMSVTRLFTNLLSLRGEVGYRVNRYARELYRGGSYGVYTARGQQHYLSVPVMLKVSAPFEHSLSVLVGPRLDVMLWQRDGIDVKRAETPRMRMQGVEDAGSPAAPTLTILWWGIGEMRRLVVGGGAGAAYSLEDLIGWPVQIEVRYNHDFMPTGRRGSGPARKQVVEGAVRVLF